MFCTPLLKQPIFCHVLRNPLYIGTALGFGIAAGILPGGFDAHEFYLRPYFPGTTAPAWVYLFTSPFALLPWPFRWQIWVSLSVLISCAATLAWPKARVVFVIASSAFIWNIWLGQNELFPVAGLFLSLLVLRRQIHPIWLGLAWLAFLVKPQTSWVILLLITWWIWKDLGMRAIVWGATLSIGIILLTLFLWPDWPIEWYKAVSTLHPTWWNAAIWPYGLLSLPFALFPYQVPQQQRLRMVAAVSLLGSPYFSLYHCITLLTLSTSHITLGILIFALSWLPVVLQLFLSGQWLKMGWILPLGILIYDLVTTFFRRPTSGRKPLDAASDPWH